MADDKQPKEADEDLDETSANAADEPTAVWDAETLRQAGLDAFSKLPEARALPPATPATPAPNASIVVNPRATGAQFKPVPDPSPAVPATPHKEMSWTLTLGLAAGLGAIVYLLIRLLR